MCKGTYQSYPFCKALLQSYRKHTGVQELRPSSSICVPEANAKAINIAKKIWWVSHCWTYGRTWVCQAAAMEAWEGICPGNISGGGEEQGGLREEGDVTGSETASCPKQPTQGPPSSMPGVGARREPQRHTHTARPSVCAPNPFMQTWAESFLIKQWKGFTLDGLLTKQQSSSLPAFHLLLVLLGTSLHSKGKWQGRFPSSAYAAS